MSSWTSCTIGPAKGIAPEELRMELGASFGPDIRSTAGAEESADLLPSVYDEWGVLSRPLSTASRCDKWLLPWVSAVSDSVRVLYILSLSDTTDDGKIRVFEPTDTGRLAEIRTQRITVGVDREKRGDENFPEHAMKAHPYSIGDHRITIDRETNCLDDLEGEFGARPLVHYGGGVVHIDRDASGEEDETNG
jgi:hypothetical protein